MQNEKKDHQTVVGKMNEESKVVAKEDRDARPEKEDNKTAVGKMNGKREGEEESQDNDNDIDHSLDSKDNKAATNSQGKNFGSSASGTQAASREGAGGDSKKGALQAGKED